jgi:hypothetical protein
MSRKPDPARLSFGAVSPVWATCSAWFELAPLEESHPVVSVPVAVPELTPKEALEAWELVEAKKWIRPPRDRHHRSVGRWRWAEARG